MKLNGSKRVACKGKYGFGEKRVIIEEIGFGWKGWRLVKGRERRRRVLHLKDMGLEEKITVFFNHHMEEDKANEL